MKSTEAQSEMIDIREAARMCGIGRTTFDQLVRAGKAPSGTKLGRSRRWNAADLRAWLEAGIGRESPPTAAEWATMRKQRKVAE